MTDWQQLLAQCQFHLDAGDTGQAEATLLYLIHIQPQVAEGHFRLGNLYANLGLFERAIPYYEETIRLQPTNVLANNNLAVMLVETGRALESIAIYHRAIAIAPGYADAIYNLGNAYKLIGRIDEAIDCYKNAIHSQPTMAVAHNNLAICMGLQGDLDAAIEHYQHALAITPTSSEALNGLGLMLSHLGNYAEAMQCFDRALQMSPNSAETHYNRGLTCLLQSNFSEGWKGYNWRWHLPGIANRKFDKPMWTEQSPRGKTILLHAEQGLGDTIQFIRFAKLVQDLGAKVVLECPVGCEQLLPQCQGVDEWVSRNATHLPHYDYHCSLMSLGQRFVHHASDIPANGPYLKANAERTGRWASELGQEKTLNIGIAWRGSPGYRWDHLRSFPLERLAPLAAVQGVRLVSLQKGNGVSELGKQSFPVQDFGSRLDLDGQSFIDTAALMESLDLIISADTSIAHLAGALGKPVWIALSLACDWRWHVGSDTSPWYPTARLFRQTVLGDWQAVFERMADELSRLASVVP